MANNEAHIRIDEGIKRGKRQPRPSRTALEAAQRVLSVPLRPLGQLDPETRQKLANSVLERYNNGEQIAAIAPEYGVSDVTIYAVLLREHSETWRDSQTARALARLERAQNQLDVASDALSLARARETLRGAQWELERLISRIYGPKQEVTIEITGDLGNRLRRAKERVIEGEVVAKVTSSTATSPEIPFVASDGDGN